MNDADRAQHEKDVESALVALFAAQYHRVLTNPQSPDWNRWASDLRLVLFDRLSKVYGQAHREKTGKESNLAYTNHVLGPLVGMLTKRIIENTQTQTAEALQKAKDREGLAVLLMAIFSLQRAANIAITEVTRSITFGEQSAVATYSAETGEILKPYWVTERDGLVCDICRPLDAQPEEVYRSVAPMGPPAHNRCRCRLRYEVQPQ